VRIYLEPDKIFELIRVNWVVWRFDGNRNYARSTACCNAAIGDFAGQSASDWCRGGLIASRSAG
jgi:hypothetical protein